MSGHVYAVASGKGGVGKTTTVVNLGVMLRKRNHTVALVDADLGMANLSTLLGVDHEPTLHDVLAGEAELEEAIAEEAQGFGVVCSSRSLGSYAAADPSGLGDVLEELAERYEFVLVDTGAGLSHEDVLPLGLADDVLLVTSPDPAAVGDTEKTVELVGLVGGSIRGVVLTKATESTDPGSIGDRLGVAVLTAVPDERTVSESTARGKPLAAYAPDSAAAAAYTRLADVLAGEEAPPVDAPARAAAEGAGASADARGTTGSSVEGEANAGGSGEVTDGDAAGAPDGGDDRAPDEVGTDDEPGEPDEEIEEAAGEPSAGSEEGADEAGEAEDEVTEEPADETDGEAVESDGAAGEGSARETDDGGAPDGAGGGADEANEADGKGGGFLSWFGRLFG